MIAFRNCGAVSPIDQRKKGGLDLVGLSRYGTEQVASVTPSATLVSWRREKWLTK